MSDGKLRTWGFLARTGMGIGDGNDLVGLFNLVYLQAWSRGGGMGESCYSKDNGTGLLSLKMG